MFKKILVPLDGTKESAKILPHVVELAKGQQADITLLTVGNVLEKICLADAGTVIFESVVGAFQKTAERNLVKTAYVLKAKGLDVNWIYKEGLPDQVIVQYAAENSCDLIAMATRNRSKFARIFGSVAEQVLMQATVPVLLTRAAEDQTDGEKW